MIPLQNVGLSLKTVLPGTGLATCLSLFERWHAGYRYLPKVKNPESMILLKRFSYVKIQAHFYIRLFFLTDMYQAEQDS